MIVWHQHHLKITPQKIHINFKGKNDSFRVEKFGRYHVVIKVTMHMKRTINTNWYICCNFTSVIWLPKINNLNLIIWKQSETQTEGHFTKYLISNLLIYTFKIMQNKERLRNLPKLTEEMRQLNAMYTGWDPATEKGH